VQVNVEVERRAKALDDGERIGPIRCNLSTRC
jgi:hypothetical protein